MLAHQPFDALAVTGMSLLPQLLGHPWAAIATFVLLVNTPNTFNPQAIGQLAGCFTPATPGVVTAARHGQYCAQLANRILFAHRFNHLIALFYSSERMPRVFFKISRCIVTRASSLRSCWISRLMSSGLLGTGPSTGLASGPYSLFQSRRFQ